MPAFQISKSIVLETSISQAYEAVRDFTTWPKWSPWLICDPDCEVAFDEDGMGYSWDGPVAGSGAMRIESVEENRKIEYDLTFFKPWRSEARVQFAFSSKGEAVEVQWNMQSSLPFFMSFMKRMMVAWIGMDYERGLRMLKDYVETGSVPSRLEFGEKEFEAFSFVGLAGTCSIPKIGESMEQDFAKLNEWIGTGAVEPTGAPFSIYHKWDMVNQQAVYTIGYPVAEAPEEIPDEFVTGTRPDMTTYAVTHTGPYTHLGNAWSAGVMHSRSGVFKQRKRVHPFEVYETEPGTVPENETRTVVHFPRA